MGNWVITHITREARRRSVKKAHDRKSRKLLEIDVGQSVFFQHTEGQNWKLGKGTGILGPNTHQVSGRNGGMYRRMRIYMRPTKVIPKARDLSPVIQPHDPDETPLTLPVEYPQKCPPPADRPVKNRQLSSGKESIDSSDSPEQSLSANRPRLEIRQSTNPFQGLRDEEETMFIFSSFICWIGITYP